MATTITKSRRREIEQFLTRYMGAALARAAELAGDPIQADEIVSDANLSLVMDEISEADYLARIERDALHYHRTQHIQSLQRDAFLAAARLTPPLIRI